ncbi:MAG: pantoate--beta-alanine ligase [Bacteroidales bacterium]
MKIIAKKEALKKAVRDARNDRKMVGLVPTMGALHQGHLSLIETAVGNGDFIVVSIFVNPTQFNDPRDLEQYPRDMEADLAMLQEYPVDIVFAPSVEEMYPEKDTRIFDLSPLDSVLEGKYRPGHFNGVAQIVSKLFYAANPDKAYFGKKDFQQLTVIKKLASILDMEIEIVGCPIIREKDGLAMSSRNRLLGQAERAAAPFIYETLQQARQMKKNHMPGEIQRFVTSAMDHHPLITLEYFEIVDDQHLHPVLHWNGPADKVGCIAVLLGGVRLIDNIYFN